MRRLALAGHGIVLLPTFLVADDVRAKRLRPLLAGVLDADTALYALHPHRTLVPAKVRAFVDDLARHCGERPYWDRGL
jgi:DNA-binding transcriptional LysR family regulator